MAGEHSRINVDGVAVTAVRTRSPETKHPSKLSSLIVISNLGYAYAPFSPLIAASEYVNDNRRWSKDAIGGKTDSDDRGGAKGGISGFRVLR
jgi:hypothetical protein